jgi:hypothetical protein
LIENVGMNPTRTGLLDILRSMGGGYRGAANAASAARSRWRTCWFAPRAEGIEVPVALVPLAIDEFPVLFIAAACAARRDRDYRRRGTAREGKRSHCRHERGLKALGVQHRYCPTACASKAAGEGPPSRR